MKRIIIILKWIRCFINHRTFGILGNEITGVGGAWWCKWCMDKDRLF